MKTVQYTSIQIIILDEQGNVLNSKNIPSSDDYYILYINENIHFLIRINIISLMNMGL